MAKTTIKYHILKWTQKVSNAATTIEYKSEKTPTLTIVYDQPLPKAISDFMRRCQANPNDYYTIEEILEDQE